MTGKVVRRAVPYRSGVRVLAAAAAGLEAVLGSRRTAGLPAGEEWRCLAAMHHFHTRSGRAARRMFPALHTDRLGIPQVTGAGDEVWRALGFATATARYFQMDLIRRRAAGRSVDLLGADWADRDAAQRPLGFAFYAERILDALPAEQRKMLDAYAQGVNALLDAATPWEYTALRQRPEPWQPVDSVLVVQDLFQQLTDPAVPDLEQAFRGLGEPDGRADSIPQGAGTGLDGVHHHDPAAADLLRAAIRAGRTAGEPVPTQPAAGSNGWVLSGTKTNTGALLANDIHLPLGTPGPLFFVRVTADGVPAHGFAIPGVPAVVAGANRDIAWGMTRLCGRTAERLPAGAPGTAVVVDREEEIGGGSNQTARVRLADAGPVLADGSVLRWTALDPRAVDFGLARLLSCRTLQEACDIATTSGTPPASLIMADARGRTGWTAAGRLLAAPSPPAAMDLVPPANVPQILDPTDGLLVTANQELRVLLRDGAPVTVNAYPDARARRIAELLRTRTDWDVSAVLDVQYDTDAAFYRPWAAIFAPQAEQWPRTREAILRWDGTADVQARGLHYLVLLQDLARREILAPLTTRATGGAPAAASLSGLDAEIADLVTRQDPDLLPPGFDDWPSFLAWCVETASRYFEHVLGPDVAQLTWGEVNRSRLRHPLSARLPRLARFIEQPVLPLAGCSQSVNVAATGFGAAMHMVATPGTGELWVNWPGGQSGDPLSPGHQSLFTHWIGGQAMRMSLHQVPEPFNTRGK